MPPIISICIPTRNRADQLHQTLDSITAQPIFLNTHEVEIVISDNASSDQTKEVVQPFLDRFSDKIEYFCNDEDLKDKNFTLALSHGKGRYLKLHNDTLLFEKDSLRQIVDILHSHEGDRIMPFFLNGCMPSTTDILLCSNFDEFVRVASFYSTWIGAFSISRDEFLKLKNFNHASSLQLIQTELLFRVLTAVNAPSALIINKPFLSSQHTGRKGGYNVAQVFGENYLQMLKQFRVSRQLTEKTYKQEKRRLLKYHIIPWYFDVKNEHDFQKTGFYRFMSEYRFDVFFYIFVARFLIRNMGRIVVSAMS
jgi:glycosyltransferase involved in cell wall biosynthesis